ncbi:g1792 [Coccomyxa viridis]|uniref:G1792 protein n=1 Tax=Coccomyxa viridis TaxID=1274662 RepID=A0ABP1FQN8_9CHLO
MRALPAPLLLLLCQSLLCVSVIAAGGGLPILRCASSELLTGPNELQIARFRATLSDPTALETHFSYHYSASLITDGLANGTDPVYVYTMPRFIVTANSPEDVVAAVQFAADYRLKVSALGGGHQLAGLALPECGVTIEMYKLQDLSFDPASNQTTVQMGVKSGAIANALTNKYHRLPSIGTCFDVCVAGFALQGGLGLIYRYHGTGADFIQSMDVVTVGADNKAVRRRIAADSEPDLFWGMRGAGGSLGVAIEYTTRTFAVPDNVQMASYTFDISIAQEVFTWFVGVVPTCPRSIYAAVTAIGGGQPASVFLEFNNLGPQTAGTEACFQLLTTYAAPRALQNAQPGQPYTIQDYYHFASNTSSSGECGNNTAATYWNTYFTANGTSTVGTIPLGLIQATIAQAKANPYDTFSISIAAGPSLPQGEDAKYFTPNAWSFRDCYYVFVGDTWNVPADDASHISYMKAASAAVKPYVAGNYINQLMMEDPNDAKNSYEAGIFTRLEGVKAAYDPNNLFRDLHYVHPNVQVPKDIFHGDIYDALPFATAEALAPAPATAMSGVEAPRPMQG